MIEVYTGKLARVDYSQENKYLLFQFHGTVNIEEAKMMYSTVLTFMKNNKTVAFVNDLSQLKGTFTGLNNWLVEQMKHAVQMGLKYDAIVVNHDIFTSFAIDDLKNKVKMLELQLFSRLEDAEKWVMEKIASR